MAVGAITLTAHRREVIDYTDPIESQYYAFVYKKATGRGGITTLEQLYNVPNIKFGILASSATETFFKHSPEGSIYKKIWDKNQVSDVFLCTHWSVDEKTLWRVHKGI